jgi:hypothetical protein
VTEHFTHQEASFASMVAKQNSLPNVRLQLKIASKDIRHMPSRSSCPTIEDEEISKNGISTLKEEVPTDVNIDIFQHL